MTDDTTDPLEFLRQCSGDPQALGESGTATASGCGGWSACAWTAGCRAGSTPPTCSRRPSSTSPAGSAEYAGSPTMPFFLWLRLVTGQRLQTAAPPAPRGADARRRPRGLAPPRRPAAGHHRLAGRPAPRPVHLGRRRRSQRAELQLRLQEALNGMDPIDREVLALRHFEELTNAETAQVLGHRADGRQQPLRPGLKRLRRCSEDAASSTNRNDPSKPVKSHRRGRWSVREASSPASRHADGLADGARRRRHVPRARARPGGAPGRGVPRPPPRGERPTSAEYTDKYPELAERDPRRLPDAGRDGGGRLRGPASERRHRDRAGGGLGPRRAAAGPARRLPHPPRGRPGRHGRRLRGRAGARSAGTSP